jgi:CubicO group peptidase (beta-lactamase class C family)
MKMRFTVMLFCVVSAVVSTGFGHTSQPSSMSLQGRVDAWRVADGVTGMGAVTITRAGRELAASGRVAVRGQIPFDVHSTVILGSTAKAITALAALRLVDAGKLNLDAPVAGWIPEFKTARGFEQRLTMRQLLTHQGGMPPFLNLSNGALDGSFESAAKNLSNDARLEEPSARDGWYSNTGYILAGLVIERVAGKSFEAFVTQEILEPLGLEDSGFLNSAFPPRFAPSGHLEFLGVSPLTAIFGREYAPVSSTLAMSVSDVGRYLEVILRGGAFGAGRILSQRSFAEWLRFQNMVRTQGGPFAWNAERRGYALGWFIERIENTEVLEHLGSTGTSSSLFMVAPSRGIAVGILLNHNRDGSLDALGHEILKGLLEHR